MKLLLNQLSLIIKLKTRLIKYFFKQRNDSAYLVSMFIIFLFICYNVFTSIYMLPMVEIFINPSTKLLLSNILPIFVAVSWIMLATVGGINLSHTLNKKQILRYPISNLNFALINIVSQIFDIGILLFLPFLFLLIYLLNLSGYFQIVITIILYLLLILNSILIVNILKLLLNAKETHLKTKYYLGVFSLLIIIIINIISSDLIINSFHDHQEIEHILLYFIFYPPITIIKVLNNLTSGNNFVSLFWLLTLLFETVLIFVTYIYILRNTTPLFIIKKNKHNRREKLFIKLLNKIPPNKSIILKDVFCYLGNKRIQIWFLLAFLLEYAIIDFETEAFIKYILMISIPISVLITLASNFFAYENKGFYLYFFIPISLNEIILQKKLGVAIISVIYTIPFVFFALIVNSVNIYIILITVPLLSYQIFIFSLFGTAISIYFPYSVKYNTSIGQFNPMAAQPFILFSFVIAEGLLALVIISFINNKPMMLFTLILLLTCAVIIYNYTLKYFFKELFLRKKETLVMKIIKGSIKLYE